MLLSWTSALGIYVVGIDFDRDLASGQDSLDRHDGFSTVIRGLLPKQETLDDGSHPGFSKVAGGSRLGRPEMPSEGRSEGVT
jgi:hypothetical protein